MQEYFNLSLFGQRALECGRSDFGNIAAFFPLSLDYKKDILVFSHQYIFPASQQLSLGTRNAVFFRISNIENFFKIEACLKYVSDQNFEK